MVLSIYLGSTYWLIFFNENDVSFKIPEYIVWVMWNNKELF